MDKKVKYKIEKTDYSSNIDIINNNYYYLNNEINDLQLTMDKNNDLVSIKLNVKNMNNNNEYIKNIDNYMEDIEDIEDMEDDEKYYIYKDIERNKLENIEFKKMAVELELKRNTALQYNTELIIRENKNLRSFHSGKKLLNDLKQIDVNNVDIYGNNILMSIMTNNKGQELKLDNEAYDYVIKKTDLNFKNNKGVNSFEHLFSLNYTLFCEELEKIGFNNLKFLIDNTNNINGSVMPMKYLIMLKNHKDLIDDNYINKLIEIKDWNTEVIWNKKTYKKIFHMLILNINDIKINKEIMEKKYKELDELDKKIVVKFLFKKYKPNISNNHSDLLDIIIQDGLSYINSNEDKLDETVAYEMVCNNRLHSVLGKKTIELILKDFDFKKKITLENKKFHISANLLDVAIVNTNKEISKLVYILQDKVDSIDECIFLSKMDLIEKEDKDLFLKLLDKVDFTKNTDTNKSVYVEIIKKIILDSSICSEEKALSIIENVIFTNGSGNLLHSVFMFHHHLKPNLREVLIDKIFKNPLNNVNEILQNVLLNEYEYKPTKEQLNILIDLSNKINLRIENIKFNIVNLDNTMRNKIISKIEIEDIDETMKLIDLDFVKEDLFKEKLKNMNNEMATMIAHDCLKEDFALTKNKNNKGSVLLNFLSDKLNVTNERLFEVNGTLCLLDLEKNIKHKNIIKDIFLDVPKYATPKKFILNENNIDYYKRNNSIIKYNNLIASNLEIISCVYRDSISKLKDSPEEIKIKHSFMSSLGEELKTVLNIKSIEDMKVLGKHTSNALWGLMDSFNKKEREKLQAAIDFMIEQESVKKINFNAIDIVLNDFKNDFKNEYDIVKKIKNDCEFLEKNDFKLLHTYQIKVLKENIEKNIPLLINNYMTFSKEDQIKPNELLQDLSPQEFTVKKLLEIANQTNELKQIIIKEMSMNLILSGVIEGIDCKNLNKLK